MSTTSTPHTLTIRIPSHLAEVLAPFEGSLTAQYSEVEGLLREALWEVSTELQGIVETEGLDAADLRQLVVRLDTIATAVEAVA